MNVHMICSVTESQRLRFIRGAVQLICTDAASTGGRGIERSRLPLSGRTVIHTMET